MKETAVTGWTRATGTDRKHPTLDLWRNWVHENGAEIWQGRPYEDKAKFVYRVVRPGGASEEFKLLNEAKRAGSLATGPDAAAQRARHARMVQARMEPDDYARRTRPAVMRRRGPKFQQGNALGPAPKVYRCVYCGIRVNDRMKLPSHEAQCDARFVVRRMWAMVIEKARQREARERGR